MYVTSTAALTITPTSAPSNYIGCFSGPSVFNGGLTICQAAAESPRSSPIPFYIPMSGYGYYYCNISSYMCVNSCFKYGFIYAGTSIKSR